MPAPRSSRAVEGPEIIQETRRKMDQFQKEKFVRDTRGLAHELYGELSGRINVDKLEDTANKLIKGLVNAYHENSTQYTVKIKDRTNLWYIKELSAEKKKFRILKHAYEHAKHYMAKRTAWKDQEAKLTAMTNKARTDEKQGRSEKIVTPADIAKVTKFAKSGPSKEIALVKDRNGALASSPEEALKNLCEAHFPGSKVTNEDEILRSTNINNAHTLKAEREYNDHGWITIQRIRKALNSFGNNKATGLDGLKPETLKLMSDEFLEVVMQIYNGMLTMHHTPMGLRTSKVIMLANPGKEDYSLPKSYRPISLTTFLFKLLERGMRGISWKRHLQDHRFTKDNMRIGWAGALNRQSARSSTK